MMTNIEMKQTAYDNQYTRLKIDDTSQGIQIIVPSPWGYRRVTVRCPYDFIGPARPSCGDLAGSLRLLQESTIIFGPKMSIKNGALSPPSPYGARTRVIRCYCNVSTGLRFFQICHCAE